MMTFKKSTKQLDTLVNSLLTFTNEKELSLFLRDLLTEAEISELAGRLAVAQALSEGKSQRVVARETGISIATVTRVNKWVKRGTGGFRLLLERLSSNKVHSDEHHPHKA